MTLWSDVKRLGLLFAVGFSLTTCSSEEGHGGPTSIIGEPCMRGEETDRNFPGSSTDVVTVSLRNPDCGGGACVSHAFQGRLDCPYGNAAGPFAPEECQSDARVPPQLVARRPEDAVYCTCRCAGVDPAEYCTCPASMYCVEIYPPTGFDDELSVEGPYCIKEPERLDSDDFRRHRATAR